MKQNIVVDSKEKLWTQSFVSACVANFLLFSAFYLLLPILPLYLIEVFEVNKSSVGIILACYTLAALIIRPVSGFILDMFNRKPLYLLFYFLFVLCFVGYTFASLITVFILIRVLHGLTFGVVTTAGSSLIVDIMPASRRGEGLGYFGVANNLAMAIGPMISLFLHDFYSYDVIFYIAIGCGLAGFLVANTIRVNKKVERTVKQPIVLDRFFLPQGLSAGASLMLLAIPYGILTTFIAIYGEELGVRGSIGLFFSLMAVGLIVSRLFSGKMVDKGKLIFVILWGVAICSVAFLGLASLQKIDMHTHNLFTTTLFYFMALILGVGYGMLFPAYNTLFVNLAPNNRRASASSTYLTSWDIGIGIGLVLGGLIADTLGGLPLAYFVGALCVAISFFIFKYIAAPHYNKNKLR